MQMAATSPSLLRLFESNFARKKRVNRLKGALKYIQILGFDIEGPKERMRQRATKKRKKEADDMLRLVHLAVTR